MENGRQPKPGDRIYRPVRIKRHHLRRVMGVPALFSIGYGDVGSSIYYGLGVVALIALGATPIALGVAGIIYVFNAFSYAEGSAALPEGGGSASFARHAFNDFISFISGWALMLSYIATMAISAYTIPPYLAYFWPVLKEPAAGTLLAMGIILFLMLINIIGIKESSRLNIFFIIIDILTQITMVTLGIFLILLPNPKILSEHMFGAGNWPSTKNLILGIAFAALCFTGVESISQHGEETREPGKRIPQASILMTVAVLLIFAGISIVAMTAMTPQVLGDPINGWARDPIAGIASAISAVMSPDQIAANITSDPAIHIVIAWLVDGVRNILPVLVAVLAATILLVATNAGLLGISRLAYNLSSNRQLPATLNHIHGRFRTPYIAIILFSCISLIMLIPGFFSASFFSDLGALYVFGSLLCFALAHAAVIGLRIRKPDLPRPFKLIFNMKIKGREIPLTAVLGLISTLVIWLIIIFVQPFSRWSGIGWMTLGITVYYLYRRSQHLPLTHLDNKPPEHE